MTPTSSPVRELYLHTDPAAVGAWCREHARPGTIFVAPSAAARRGALQRVVGKVGVTLGLAVTSPARLLPLLESRAGLPTPKALSSTLERLLVAESARLARVPLFDEDGRDAPAGAVSAVATLITSLRRNRVTPEQFVDAGGDARVADAYRRFEARRWTLGFADEVERVDALFAAGLPAVTLVIEDPAFPNRLTWELYEGVMRASSSCRIGVAALGTHGSAPAWTAQLDALGFTRRDESTPLGDATKRAIGGVGMHDETELVAREMLALLRSTATVRDEHTGAPRPIRASDLLGVAPNGTYLSLLNESCTRLGIPVASPRQRDVGDVPLVRALLDTFHLLADADEDTAERGLALLATPYLGLSLDRQDRLSRTLLIRGLGALRSWRRFAPSTRRTRFIKLADEVSALASRLEGERTPRELAAALTSLGLDFGFLSSGRRSHLAASRDDALRLDQQGWDALATAAEELNDALHSMGVSRISARRWLGELREVISGSSVRVDAKARDGVHLTVAGAGLPSAAHVFAVGWREGLVPRRTREEPLLPDRVKKALNAQGARFALSADRASQEAERRDRVHRAARKSLTISWPATAEDGARQLPSFYMDDLDVKSRAERSIGDTTWALGIAASRAERIARATMLSRHRPADSLGAELAAVRDTLASITTGEKYAYDGLLHSGQAIQLPTEILAECTPLAATMSASQARQVVHCLYEHFGKRRLGLESLGAPQLQARELGTIAHCVLNELGRVAFDPSLLAATLDRWWTAKVPRETRRTAAAEFDREMLFANLSDLLMREREHLAISGSRPAYFELAFGLADEDRDPASRPDGLTVPLPEGTALRASTLRGSIDRVDVVERDGKQYGVAIDYKFGKGESYGKELTEMADFQLPIYCEVLPLFGIEPVGAFYLGIASSERYGVVRSDFAEQFVPENTKGVRTLEPEDFRVFMRERQLALRSEIARLAKGELATKPRNDDCGYCDLRPVCRIGTFGVGGKSVED